MVPPLLKDTAMVPLLLKDTPMVPPLLKESRVMRGPSPCLGMHEFSSGAMARSSPDAVLPT